MIHVEYGKSPQVVVVLSPGEDPRDQLERALEQAALRECFVQVLPGPGFGRRSRVLFPNKQPCPVCRGNGQVALCARPRDEDDLEDCAWCDGTGLVGLDDDGPEDNLPGFETEASFWRWKEGCR